MSFQVVKRLMLGESGLDLRLKRNQVKIIEA